MQRIGRKIALHWQQRDAVSVALFPLSLLFRSLVALRRAMYRLGLMATKGVRVPVVIVGNISVGGTGKTPLVVWLARRLSAEGCRPAILTRGYGGTERAPRRVTPASPPEEHGDEPVLLARRAGVPVFAGVDRAALAQYALAEYPECDVLISDDGLQHYALARAIEIAVVDGRRGLGNGWMLPAGPLREPVSRLREVDAVVVNGPVAAAMPHAKCSMRLEGKMLYNVTDPDRRLVPTALVGQTVHAVAGIGDPGRFFDTLTALGLTVVPHAFDDHYRFGAIDFLAFGDAPVIMTEKDAVKCTHFAAASHWYLPVDAVLDLALDRLILDRLGKPYGSQTSRNSRMPDL